MGLFLKVRSVTKFQTQHPLKYAIAYLFLQMRLLGYRLILEGLDQRSLLNINISLAQNEMNEFWMD